VSARGQSDGSESKPGRFATTHWSLICLAGRESDSPEVAAARDELCRSYWYPIYAHIRRLGQSSADAQDLTQEFFARMLRSHGFAAAKREKGRFRSFTLGALKHFLSDARDRAGAQKRGGGLTILSLEQDLAEARIAREPVDTESPDRLFERRWALTIIEHALARLRAEAVATNRAEQYDALKDHFTGHHRDSSCAESARKLGLSESAVKSAIHRLRRRYGQMLREEVAKTVLGPEEVDDEIRHLLGVLEASQRHD
jgi:RNA polymerase sigma factor (sigma-70 family)